MDEEEHKVQLEMTMGKNSLGITCPNLLPAKKKYVH